MLVGSCGFCELWWVAVRPQKIPIRTYQNLIEPITPHQNLIFSTLSLGSLENIRSLGTPKKLTSIKTLKFPNLTIIPLLILFSTLSLESLENIRSLGTPKKTNIAKILKFPNLTIISLLIRSLFLFLAGKKLITPQHKQQPLSCVVTTQGYYSILHRFDSKSQATNELQVLSTNSLEHIHSH